MKFKTPNYLAFQVRGIYNFDEATENRILALLITCVSPRASLLISEWSLVAHRQEPTIDGEPPFLLFFHPPPSHRK